ncbi:HEAT repeat domain-containing protein [Halovivax limisalsi]|uniref:HEAT repeat domain-containing protein n=1 Tax=Halovivax limisalsi TaxID=1453760 RepID=UPI001FFDD97E|nr:HEAT repeat domain-containing protein [Halovivax limisalsi]
MTDESAPDDGESGAPDEQTGDESAESTPETASGPDVASIEASLDAVEAEHDALAADLEAAETEDDLDDVEAALADVREDLEAIEIPEPPEEPDDEEEDAPPDPYEDVRERRDELEDDLDDVASGIEDQRGPYAEDVVSDLESASGDIESTRWTREGIADLYATIETAVAESEAALDTPLHIDDSVARNVEPAAEDEPRSELDERIEEAAAGFVSVIDDLIEAVEDADLDPDDDAATIAAMLEVTDDLQSGVDDATAWDDLEVREQLVREGFYEGLGHVKDFPPEWHALKVHERQGNVDMILLALESLDSDYMEEHCLEALERVGDERAVDAMLQKANRRDEAAIAVLGKIGVADDEVVDTLLDYVDSGNLSMQATTFRALGELGATEAVQPIADQLAADDEAIRSRAARALGLIGDTRAIDPLADRLESDESDTVRASAAWALRQIGVPAALEAAAAYADDRTYLVQTEAERAKRAIGD